MLEFVFRVNKSFLGSTSKPITVPRSRVDYGRLRGSECASLEVIAPTGEIIESALYYGRAGFGEYYQVRMHSANARTLSRLKLGSQLRVVLKSDHGRLVAHLISTDTQ